MTRLQLAFATFILATSTDAAAGAAYYWVEPACASPDCGYVVARVDQPVTTCPDGLTWFACWVPTVEGVDVPDVDAPLGVIARGAFADDGALAATEAWQAGTASGWPLGVPVRVDDSGIRCVQAPCLSLVERRLDGTGETLIADLDFSLTGASDDELATAWTALAEGDLIVFGFRTSVTGPGGTEKARAVTQYYVPVSDGCYVGGCSSQVCSDDPDVVTTCEWLPEYACYQDATCARQPDGACGWTPTPELLACLADPPPGPMSPAECESLGGFVRGDIGDGSVTCEPDEDYLGDVATGIEGGVCCATP